MLPHGPKEISRNRQIALPAELMAQVRLEIGDQVYVAKAEEPAGALLVLPVELLSRWIDEGRRVTRDHESERPDL